LARPNKKAGKDMTKSVEQDAVALDYPAVHAMRDEEYAAHRVAVAREYVEQGKRSESVTYAASVATVEADARGLFKQGRGKDAQGFTQSDWAATFGVTGSSASSRVTLWRNLGTAARKGITRDEEAWSLLVSGDLANRDGVRQVIAKGTAAQIRKAAIAKAAGQKTGKEEGGKKAQPEAGTGTGEDASTDGESAPTLERSMTAGNFEAAVMVLSAWVGDPERLERMTPESIVACVHSLRETADAIEAEAHRRNNAKRAAQAAKTAQAGRKTA
jgi:hypothetical protein